MAQLGAGQALFYKQTGDKKYLDAALRWRAGAGLACARRETPSTLGGPRADARYTGVTLALEEYGGGWHGQLLRLFDELIRINAGDVATFRAARGMALKWMLDYPLNHDSGAWNKWSGFFEDIPRHVDDVNQLTPMMAAYYILSREDPAEADPQWVAHVGRLLDWVRIKLGRGPFFGAQAIDEQTTPDASFGCCSRAGQGDHTARWAAINALFFEKTRDGQAREDAYRSLNYATYFAGADGMEIACWRDRLR